MSFRFACPGCQGPFEADQSMLGQPTKCSHCGIDFMVPMVDAPAEPASAPRPVPQQPTPAAQPVAPAATPQQPPNVPPPTTIDPLTNDLLGDAFADLGKETEDKGDEIPDIVQSKIRNKKIQRALMKLMIALFFIGLAVASVVLVAMKMLPMILEDF